MAFQNNTLFGAPEGRFRRSGPVSGLDKHPHDVLRPVVDGGFPQVGGGSDAGRNVLQHSRNHDWILSFRSLFRRFPIVIRSWSLAARLARAWFVGGESSGAAHGGIRGRARHARTAAAPRDIRSTGSGPAGARSARPSAGGPADWARDTGPPHEERITAVGNLGPDHPKRDQGEAAAVSRSLRRGSLAAIAAIAIASLSACAAGNNAETLEVKPDNTSVTLGTDLRLNNIVVVTGDETSGEHTGPANVTVNISNTGAAPAKLQSINVEGGGTATLTDPSGAPLKELIIKPGDAVLLGGPGQPTARLASATLQVGGFVPTTFAFEQAGQVQAEAAVYANFGYYKGFGPTAAPVAPASPSASPSAAGAASPAAAPSPTAGGTAAAGAKPTGPATASGSPLAAAH